MEENKPSVMFETHVYIHHSIYLLPGMGVTVAFGYSILTVHPSFSFVPWRTEMAPILVLEEGSHLQWKEGLGLGAVLKTKISYLQRVRMGIYIKK